MPLARKPTFEEGFNQKNLKRTIPSWLISLILHALVLLLLMLGVHRSGRPDGNRNGFGTVLLIGSNDKTFRDGGGGGDNEDGQEDTPAGAQTANSETTDASPIIISKPDPPNDEASVAQSLLTLPDSTSLDGTSQLPLSTTRQNAARPSLPTRMPGNIRSITSKGRGGKNGPGGKSGPGSGIGEGTPNGTSFFSIAAQGDFFCYVVDSSASMDGAAMGLARAELMASIERLDSVKKFQILFYNSDLHLMTKGREDSFYATEINRTFARQFIANQQPESSTQHMPALAAGLARAPDVIFFLTDGDIPALTPDELKKLVRLNRNNTQIHVIEFGQNAKLGPVNWLERLAKDHKGTYRYRDVNALQKD